MSDQSQASLNIREATEGNVRDLLTLDSVSPDDGNGSALRFINSSSEGTGLHSVLGRVQALRVNSSTLRMDLALAPDPTVSSGDDTIPLLSLVNGLDGLSVTTAAGSTLAVGGTLSVTGDTTLNAALNVAGNTSLRDLRVSGNLEIAGKLVAAEISGVGAAVRGMIVMWSGQANNIPAGWVLCNGQNGTPDLRSRFIVGAGPGGNPAYDPGTFGDPDQHTHRIDVPPTSAATSFAGQHNHAPPDPWYDRSLLEDVAAAGKVRRNSIDRGSPSVEQVRTSSDGNHNHGVTIDPQTFDSVRGGGENRPRWFALCFIMKV